MRTSIKEAPKNGSHFTPDDASYAAGAQIYKDHCAVCHGLPGQPQTAIAKGEFPNLQKLLEEQGRDRRSGGRDFWKVADGIRITGMPGFDKSLSEDADVGGQFPDGECGRAAVSRSRTPWPLRLLQLLLRRLRAPNSPYDGIVSLLRIFMVGDYAAGCGDRPLHPAASGFLLAVGNPDSLDRSAGLHRGRGNSGRRAAARFVSGVSAAAAN